MPQPTDTTAQVPSASPPSQVCFSESRLFDLPNPEPNPPTDSFPTGIRPTGVVAFNGLYVVVGTVWLETYAGPGRITPGYDPARNRGVVWTSPDGLTWTLHDGIAAFAHSTVTGVATDGTWLVAYGYYAKPAAGRDATRAGATWASTDGVHWTMAAGPAPSIVAGGSTGFVGALTTEDWEGTVMSVRFATSSDGLTWMPRSSTFHAGLGDAGAALGLAMAEPSRSLAMSDSGAVFAGGTGGPSGADAELWYSANGRTWYDSGLVPNGSVLAVVASSDTFRTPGDTFLAVTASTSPESGQPVYELWAPHLFAEPGEFTDSPLSRYPTDELARPSLLGDGRVVLLTSFEEQLSVNLVWVSRDGGITFERVVNPLTSPDGVITTPQGLLILGTRPVGVDGSFVPTVWLARW